MQQSRSSFTTPIAPLSLEEEVPPRLIKTNVVHYDEESIDDSIPPVPKFKENFPCGSAYKPSPIARRLTSALPLYLERTGGSEGFDVVMAQIEALKKTAELCRMTPDQIITLVSEAFGV